MKYILFTGHECNPCATVKSMVAQSKGLKPGVSLEIVDAETDPRTVTFAIRGVPTLVNESTGEKTTGVLAIVQALVDR